MKKNIILGIFISLFLFSGVIFAADTIMIVNSQNYEDVISGAVYASQNDITYAFILTEEHGKYWSKILENLDSDVLYYESDKPVFSNLKATLSSKIGSRLKATTDLNLAKLFADMSSNNKAIVVGNTNGAEAVSVAQLAVAEKSGLYFSSDANVQTIINNLLNSGKSVLVYGSVANHIGTISAVDVINKGSIYLDNIEVLKRMEKLSHESQLFLLSGKAFEKGLLSSKLPIALVGRTEISDELKDYILSTKKTRGVVFNLDSNIEGAILEVQKDTGISVFAQLSEGYPGDAQVRPLAVMSLPAPNVLISLHSVNYLDTEKKFEVYVENIGTIVAHVKLKAILGDGSSSESAQLSIPIGKEKMIPITMDASNFIRKNKIPSVEFDVYSGSDTFEVEAIDVVKYLNVDVIKSAKTSKPVVISKDCPTPEPIIITKSDNMLLYAMGIVLLIILGILVMQANKGSRGLVEHHHKKKTVHKAKKHKK